MACFSFYCFVMYVRVCECVSCVYGWVSGLLCSACLPALLAESRRSQSREALWRGEQNLGHIDEWMNK